MNERSAIVFGALAGAVLGGAAAFLFLTERGRRLREDLEPRLQEVVNEFQRVRLTLDQARSGRRTWDSDYHFDPAREGRFAGSGDAH